MRNGQIRRIIYIDIVLYSTLRKCCSLGPSFHPLHKAHKHGMEWHTILCYYDSVEIEAKAPVSFYMRRYRRHWRRAGGMTTHWRAEHGCTPVSTM